MTTKEFMINHKQHSDCIDADQQFQVFQEEMAKGLKGETSSLPMIPTYLAPTSQMRLNEKKILLDAGGTNFRSAVGWFDEDGQAEIRHLSKSGMLTERVSKEAFYDYIAKQIVPLAEEGGDIGYCFSYNVAMDNTIDGTLVAMSKELDNEALIGSKVGAETLKALSKYNSAPRKICILNDTVATLMGGMAYHIDEIYSSKLGFIFGTGTNICYVEKTNKIGKLTDGKTEEMIVNCETANYNKLPQGDFDKIVMANTADPTRSPLEKMTSGKYLADLAFEVLFAASREGLFTGITNIQPFETRDISDFLMDSNNKLYRMFKKTADRTIAKELLNCIIDRSAKVSAISLAAIAMYGHDGSSNPVAIVCEGTTFHRLTGYKTRLCDYLDEIFAKHNVSYKLIQDGQELNLVGSLLATFSL